MLLLELCLNMVQAQLDLTLFCIRLVLMGLLVRVGLIILVLVIVGKGGCYGAFGEVEFFY